MHRSGFHHGGSDKAAERAGGRVLRMPVIGGGHREGILGPGSSSGGGGQRGGGSQTPGDGDLRAHRHGETVVTQDLGDDTGRQVRGVLEEAGSLPLALHAQRGGVLDLDADVTLQRHGQRVEPRPEVGRRGWGPGAHGVRLGDSGQALEERLGRNVPDELDRHHDPLGAQGDDDVPDRRPHGGPAWAHAAPARRCASQ